MIDKATRVFPEEYNDLVHLDDIYFNLYDIEEDINKFVEEWTLEVINVACIGKEEIHDEVLVNFYKEFSFLYDFLSNAKARSEAIKN